MYSEAPIKYNTTIKKADLSYIKVECESVNGNKVITRVRCRCSIQGNVRLRSIPPRNFYNRIITARIVFNHGARIN